MSVEPPRPRLLLDLILIDVSIPRYRSHSCYLLFPHPENSVPCSLRRVPALSVSNGKGLGECSTIALWYVPQPSNFSARTLRRRVRSGLRRVSYLIEEGTTTRAIYRGHQRWGIASAAYADQGSVVDRQENLCTKLVWSRRHRTWDEKHKPGSIFY